MQNCGQITMCRYSKLYFVNTGNILQFLNPERCFVEPNFQQWVFQNFYIMLFLYDVGIQADSYNFLRTFQNFTLDISIVVTRNIN